VPDLDRALRDLLTDEHLHLPTRPDAARIVRDGVRRRRRRRAIVVSTAAAATVGAVIAAATTLPAALNAGGHHPATPVQPTLRYDVSWVGIAPPTAWSPKPVPPPPPTLDAPRCLADQLKVGPAVENDGGGVIFTTIRLRNISSHPCQLVGTPARVAAQAPGLPDVVATRGLHLDSGGVGGDLPPGHLGYLTVETDRDCSPSNARGGASSTGTYTSLSVTLPSGSSFNLPAKLNAGCGFLTGGLGVDVPPPTTPTDARSHLIAIVETPRTMRAGSASYVVTLSNPTDAAISLRHCPGYLEDLSNGGLGVVDDRYALNCSQVHAIAPHTSVRYQMRIGIPVDVTPGTYTLRWSLLVGHPVTMSDQVTVVSSGRR
jgi:hypothetical protein